MKRRPSESEGGPDERSETTVSRRAWLGSAAGAVAGAAAGGLIHTRADARVIAPEGGGVVGTTVGSEAVPEGLTVQQTPGRPPSELGSRAPQEQPRRLVRSPFTSSSSRTPLQDLQGIITPADLHFERHHGGVPAIDPDEYSLVIHGMVDRPTTFSLQDLRRFPSVSRICFMECSGNGGGVYRTSNMPTEVTPQSMDGLTSTSEWVGVPLATLFREVGVQEGATWFLAEGGDSVAMTRSVPVEKGWDDAMIAYGQNGEAIRPEQGYPARLLLPGWEGNASVKWIRRIEVSDAPFMTRDETSRYTELIGDDTARMFSFVMDAKSLITFPSYPYVLPETGWWEVQGLAWSGRGKITSVEVSTDSGRSWDTAELQEPVLSKCHTRFRYLWDWDGEETVLLSRATDETGYTQPTLQQLMAARGPRTSYHQNHIRAWKVGGDGQVVFGLGDLL